jgi:dsDNA-specific endonuclease/ATPase MutS2
MPAMRRRELSERIERHMERGEELMELNRAAFDRNTVAFERVMAALDRHEKRFEEIESEKEDLKTFIREMNMRNEKVIGNLLRRGNEFMAEERKRTDEIVVELRDGRDERRALTAALLAVVDRLPPPAQAA